MENEKIHDKGSPKKTLFASVTQKLGIGVFTIVSVIIGFILSVYFLPEFLGNFWVSALVSMLIVAGLLRVITAKIGGGKNVIKIGLGLFILPFLILLGTALPDNATPKPPPENKTINYWNLSNGTRIGYIVYEPDEPNGQPPVIILHGGPGGGTTDTDLKLAKDLATVGFTAYAYDQAGVGYSDKIDPTGFTLDQTIADLAAIQDELGVLKVNLVGHSFGGAIGAHYTVKFPNRVNKLVLSAPSSFGIEPISSGQQNLTASEEPGSLPFKEAPPLRVRIFFLVAGIGKGPAMESLFSQKQQAYFAQQQIDILEVLKSGICRGDDPGDIPLEFQYSNFNMSANILLNADLDKRDATAGLSGLNVPTLVVRGVCDYIPWEVHRLYRNEIPGAQMSIIEGVGHRTRAIEAISNFFLTGDSGFGDYRGDMIPTSGN